MQQQVAVGRVTARGIATDARREWIGRDWVGLIVVLYGTVLGLVAAFVVYRNQTLFASTIDVNGFGLLSRHLAWGDGFSLGQGPTIRRAPLYPFFGAAILKLTGHDSAALPDVAAYQPIIIAQCLLFGLTCLVTWVTARRLFGARVAVIAAALCPLIPQTLRYLGQTEVESMMGFLIVLLAYTGLRLVERPSVVTGLGFGLTAAAATLTKPVTQFYPVLFLAAAWLGWYFARRGNGTFASRGRITATLAALLCFGVVVVPWIARNYGVTDGGFVGISSNAPGEALRGYVAVQPEYVLLRKDFGAWDPEANDYEEAILARYGVPFYRSNSPENGTMQVVPPMPPGVSSAQIEAEKDRIESAELKGMVLSRPLDLARKVVIQLATFWYLVVDRTQSLLLGALALGLLTLAVLGLRRASADGVQVWPVLAIVVYLNVIYAGTLAMARYSMPLYPTLMILAAAGFASLLRAKRVIDS